jgi:hypothetical protein
MNCGVRCQEVGTSISEAGRDPILHVPPVAAGQLHPRHDSIERALTLATATRTVDSRAPDTIFRQDEATHSEHGILPRGFPR